MFNYFNYLKNQIYAGHQKPTSSFSDYEILLLGKKKTFLKERKGGRWREGMEGGKKGEGGDAGMRYFKRRALTDALENHFKLEVILFT